MSDVKPGSFRGVAFHCVEVSGVRGQRLQINEVPFSDRVQVGGMGAAASEIELDIFLIGDAEKLPARRQALEAVLYKGGLGDLVVPFFGDTVRAAVKDVRAIARVGERRLNAYRVAFVVDTSADESVSVDTSRRLAGAAESVTAAALDAVAMLDTGDADLNAENVGVLTRVGDTLRRVNGRVQSALADVNSVTLQINEIGRQSAQLIAAPRAAFASVAGAVSAVFAAAASIRNAVDGYSGLRAMWGGVDAVPASTPVRVRQRANNAVITRTVDALALAAVAAEIARRTRPVINAGRVERVRGFESKREALAVLDALRVDIDAQAAQAPDALRDALLDLEGELAAHVDAVLQSLARVRAVSVVNPVPLLVLAYSVTGGISTADEIAARNGLRRPALVEPGEYEVIMRG